MYTLNYALLNNAFKNLNQKNVFSFSFKSKYICNFNHLNYLKNLIKLGF